MKVVAILVAFMLSSTSVFADVCPKYGEVVQTTAYTQSTACSAGTIVVTGRKNPEKYQSCLGDVPVAEEHVSMLNSGKQTIIPSVNVLAAKDTFLSVSTRTLLVQKKWMVTRISCGPDNSVQIFYWGGGNCDSCEQHISYQFSRDGKMIKAGMR